MLRLLRRMPFSRILATGQTVLLARRHLMELEPRAFAFATANAFSPVPIPRRLARAMT